MFTFGAAANMELMVAGSAADTLYMTKDAFDRATGTANKELFLVEGAHHIQTYYVPEYVNQFVDKLTKFFNEKI